MYLINQVLIKKKSQYLRQCCLNYDVLNKNKIVRFLIKDSIHKVLKIIFDIIFERKNIVSFSK
jgi:hypothetical protein